MLRIILGQKLCGEFWWRINDPCVARVIFWEKDDDLCAARVIFGVCTSEPVDVSGAAAALQDSAVV